nr:unnamed protein product [Callosobruchus chinensis]
MTKGAAAPTTLYILDAVQRRPIRLIGDPALTCHLQPLSHRRASSASRLYLTQQGGRGLLSLEHLHNRVVLATDCYVTQPQLETNIEAAEVDSNGLKSETEGFIMACQKGVFNTLVYYSRVMSMYYHLRYSYDIDEMSVLPHAQGDIESVVEIHMNFPFPTLEVVQANKPDIVLLDERRRSRVFNSWLNQGQSILAWFVKGRTVLLPKTGDLSEPKNYRPIACLNACYKLFTRILYMRILEAVNPVFLAVSEQRGSKKGVAGCRDNLLIDRCVTQDAVQYKRNLSMAWIDY